MSIMILVSKLRSIQTRKGVWCEGESFCQALERYEILQTWVFDLGVYPTHKIIVDIFLAFTFLVQGRTKDRVRTLSNGEQIVSCKDVIKILHLTSGTDREVVEVGESFRYYNHIYYRSQRFDSVNLESYGQGLCPIWSEVLCLFFSL